MSVVANVAINIDGKQAAAVLDQIKRKVEELNGTFGSVPKQVQKTESALARMSQVAAGIASSFAFGAIVKGFNDIAVGATKFARLEGSLKAVTGSSKGAAAALQAVYRSTAITGQNTLDAARGLTQMLVAARGTAFEGGKAVQTFEQINALTVAYAGDSAKAEKAQLALQQMMSKGVVSMEELRGQLGDAIPGAMELFRKAYKDGNTNLSDFIKLVSDGKVTVNDFTNINKVLGQELDKVYGKGYSDYISKQAKFNQAMDKLRLVAGQVALVIGNALLPKLTGIIQGIADANPKLLGIAGAITTVAAAAIGLAAALSTINFALATLGIGAGAKQLGRAFAAGMAGPPQIKALTLLAAAAVGGGAALGAKSMVDEFDSAIRNMQGKLKGIMGADFKLPDATGDFTIPTDTSKEDEKALKAQSRLNQLLMENLRLNTEAGNVDKDKLAQLDGQLELLNALMPLELKQLNLTLKGQELAQARINKLLEYKTEFARVEQEIARTQAEISDLTTEALKLRVDTLGGLMPEESPLQKEIKKIKSELIDADKQAEELLKKLTELGGQRPETAAARTALGNLRADLAEADPNAIASQRIAAADIKALQDQNRELQNAGQYLTTLDQLIIKYGEDWKSLHPETKKHLTDLAKQNEELKKQQRAQQALMDLYDGIAGEIAGGVGSAIDAVTNSTENLGDALADIGRQILAAVGKMLIFYALAQAFGALGGTDGKGVFSYLGKAFGYKAKDGAYWNGGFQAFANGGMVTSPTMGLIGEGGEPEYVIPASKMRGAMQRYSSGVRGSAVIPSGRENGDGPMGELAAAPGTIDVRYTVERINSVDYVTADQFRAGMQEAAAKGAAQGEQRTLRRLQNSASTRRRLGV